MYAIAVSLLLASNPAMPSGDKGLAQHASAAKAALLARYGEARRARIERGVDQVAAAWRPSDGDGAALVRFAESSFIADPALLEATLGRFEEALEQLDGHLVEMGRALSRHAVLDVGPMIPVDATFAGLDPGAHLVDDLFDSKLAFVALLNFPLTTLAERLANADRWTRDDWARVRLTGRFARRVPAAVQQEIARAYADAQLYVAGYNLYVHHLVSGPWERPSRPFPRGMRLLSHWNLRDQIKADYALTDGLARQRLVAQAMERIVDQSIPRAVIDDPTLDWNPETNEVRPAPASEIEGDRPARAHADAAREPDTRYAQLLAGFRAVRAADPYSPIAPTYIDRKFEIDREIPETRVVAMLEEVLDSSLVPRVARLVEARLGRPLEPFDVWYGGFRPRSRHPEPELDEITRKRYPTAEAFARDMPRLLEALGFAPEKARFLSSHIVVEPARGSGHALGAARRGDDPHLRTRVGARGMDYKGYNIAVHEMGHNVEQVFSLYEVDHTLLQGVPNTACTEALAFVFQARDLELLGLARPDAAAERMRALDDLWATYEIAGVALVDIGVWHWMYEHAGATPAELREATIRIAKDVWNAHYAPVFRRRDSTLLAVYSHMIEELLYLPDYPIGHLVAAQLEEHLRRAGPLGPEVERIARYGAVTPDLWMKHATGEPLSAKALLRAAEEALHSGAAPP